jgi:hypothetical protein
MKEVDVSALSDSTDTADAFFLPLEEKREEGNAGGGKSGEQARPGRPAVSSCSLEIAT